MSSTADARVFVPVARSPSTSRGALLPVYCAATVALAALTMLLAPGDLGAAMTLVEVLAAAVFASALFPPDLRHRDFSDVAFLAGLSFFLAFGLRSVIDVAHVVARNPDGTVALFRFDNDTMLALLLGVISWAAFLVGYRRELGSRIASRLPDRLAIQVDVRWLNWATLLTAVIGWSARILLIMQRGSIGVDVPVEYLGDPLQTLLGWLEVLTSVASALALYCVFFRRVTALQVLLAAGLVGAELIAGLIQGDRTTMFRALVTAAVMASLTGRYHLRWRHFFLLPVLLLLFGFTNTYRNPSVAYAQDPGIPVRLGTAVTEAADQGPLALMSRGALDIASRYQGVDSVASIIRLGVPEVQSLGARYLIAVPAALIPRFLWPGKPLATDGVDFGHQYWGVPLDETVYIAPSWVGDLMLNLPIVVVPLAMGGLGVLLRILRGYGQRAIGGGTYAAIAYPLVLPLVLESDGWVSSAITDVTRMVAILVVLWIFVYPPGSRSPSGVR